MYLLLHAIAIACDCMGILSWALQKTKRKKEKRSASAQLNILACIIGIAKAQRDLRYEAVPMLPLPRLGTLGLYVKYGLGGTIDQRQNTYVAYHSFGTISALAQLSV